ncbi:MAG: NAD(P)-binding protein [Candidatus Latescibacteria bacterium]|nr:NAD(P)-binding protein [Candidatus Latescibacterota bacterium]
MGRANEAEQFDIVIVGAGISGIGAAYHLQQQCPAKRFVILDALASFGGTWRTHRYPGIRSDSDLHTYGYRFKPWTGAPIASGEEILKYMGEVIEENGLAPHIRYQHRIETAAWSGAEQTWTIAGIRTDTGAAFGCTGHFLWMCQGYYRHDRGYTPQWPGMDNFTGPIVHPQNWPDDLDYKDQEVLVIGSGSTAATLVPAIAADCKHVTILQRSPTFYFTGGNTNPMAEELRKLDIDETWIHEIVRRQILYNQDAFTKRAAEEPEAVKEELLEAVRQLLPEGYDMATHFTPNYRPWQQRIAVVPNGDLFACIKAGQASMVTETIEQFVEQGIRLQSGRELQADIVVTATGFNLCVLGDIEFSIDDEPVDLADTVTYRGTMFTGVPNMAWIFGYFRASWTLRVDLIGDFVCRLLNHMDKKGFQSVTPALRLQDGDMPLLPWTDPENFNPNYLMRSMHLLPRRGDKPEWQHTQDHWGEKDVFAAIDLDDPVFSYR